MEGFAAVLTHQRWNFAENNRHAVAFKWNSHGTGSGFAVSADRAFHGFFLVAVRQPQGGIGFMDGNDDAFTIGAGLSAYTRCKGQLPAKPSHRQLR